jgi:histidine ammonia-lyase
VIELTGKGLTPAEVVVARADQEVELAPEAREAMTESAAIVERLASSPEPA